MRRFSTRLSPQVWKLFASQRPNAGGTTSLYDSGLDELLVGPLLEHPGGSHPRFLANETKMAYPFASQTLTNRFIGSCAMWTRGKYRAPTIM